MCLHLKGGYVSTKNHDAKADFRMLTNRIPADVSGKGEVVALQGKRLVNMCYMDR